MKAFVFILAISSIVSAELPPYFDALADGMFTVFDNDFDRAEAIFDSLAKIYPDDPTHIVFRIMSETSALHDSENETLAVNLVARMDSAEAFCIRKWGREPTDQWGAFVTGNLLGQRAILAFVTENGSMLSAWNDGKNAAKLWEFALNDSILAIESAIGLGNFYYWISAKAGILRTFGIVSDKRDTAIALLENAACNSQLGKSNALHSLIFIYLDHGDTANALAKLDILTGIHKDSRTTKWDILIMNYVTANWDEIPPVADELMNYYRGRSDFNLCQLALVAGYAECKLENYEKSCEYYAELDSVIDNAIKKKLKRRDQWELYETLRDCCTSKRK